MNNFNFIHKNFRLNSNSFSSQKELLIFVNNLSSSIYSFLSDWFSNSDVILVNTSGSSGLPKTIQIRKEHMINSATATGAYFQLPQNTKALLCLSTEFIAGKMMLVRALILGWKIDIVEASSNPLNGITKHYDFCAMVPMQLNNSIGKLHLIKKLIVGGGPVSKDLQKRLRNVKPEVYASYGMTETITHIAVKKLNNFSEVNLNPLTALSTGSVERSYYTLLPNITISIDDHGCMVIDAPKISDKQIITNDLIELISESEFIWLGRSDNSVNSGGIKLIPEQIEKKLATYIDQRFFVTGLSDERLGEKLILVIESKKEDPTLLHKLKKGSTLKKIEIPKEIYFTEKFIETGTKKINRKKTLANLNLL